MKAEYPKFIYHEDGTSKVVASAEAHVAAGDRWHESPVDAQAAADLRAEADAKAAAEKAEAEAKAAAEKAEAEAKAAAAKKK